VRAEQTPETLLARCTLRLDTATGPQGTAFFVAPRYAVTAAHVVDGTVGLAVWLQGPGTRWQGHVEACRPATPAAFTGDGWTYPAPDVALIRIDEGPGHLCVLLEDHPSGDDSLVVARGHTQSLDGQTVTAETQFFWQDGELETPDPACTLIKLGHGQAVDGMSGAPVLSRVTGQVIGLLRTSRRVDTDLGAWVVPAQVIRELWPRQVDQANDRYHREHGLWRRVAAAWRESHRAPAPGGPNIDIRGEVITFIDHSPVGELNINAGRPPRRRPGGSGSGER
jgi:Trypsin-like peptidase domain